MPSKIEFCVVGCSGEDERYRATELNYHGPTVRGWRSARNCSYPQELILQLNTVARISKVQILSHQHLISQKIELWISEESEYDPSMSPSTVQSFDYLGFITLSDNLSTKFKSRELKSVTVPSNNIRYIKLRLHSNHINDKNVYNQVGIIAINLLGEEVLEPDLEETDEEEVPQAENNITSNPQYISPYDDLAFEMYVDKEIAKIMKIMELKKHQAVTDERFEYASKLKSALEDLREVGEILGKYEQEKHQAINLEDFDKAKSKKLQIDQYRQQVYAVLKIDQLLELEERHPVNDLYTGTTWGRSTRNPNLEPPPPLAAESEQISPNDVYQTSTSPNQHHQDQTTWEYYTPVNRPYCKPSISDYQFNRPQTPKHMNHSQSQTFDHHQHDLITPQSHTPMFRRTSYQDHVYQQAKPIGLLNINTPVHNCYDMFYSLPPAQTRSMTESYRYPPDMDDRVYGLSEETDYVNERRNSMSDSLERKNVDFDLDKNQIRPPMPHPQLSPNKSKSPTTQINRPNSLKGSLKRRHKTVPQTSAAKSSYEAYEERTLPALRNYHSNEVVRECQLATEHIRKSKLNEREKKQAVLPLSVFGNELVEKFYSKHFSDKEEGLRMLKDELRRKVKEDKDCEINNTKITPNKIARGAVFLLHRGLRDTVFSVYSTANDVIRSLFTDFIPNRVTSAEVARSVEKLLPELIAKSGDTTPRIHTMAAHTLLSMADCKQVRELHLIPVQLTRPLTSSVHPRLALSRLEMVEQLVLSHGISAEKQSGLTCRVLAEFGSSGLHHPAEAVRKVSERILLQVYKVNPRLVRKQLPPDDDVTRRNLLYRQLFQEFDFMDLQRKREMMEQKAQQAKNEEVGLKKLPEQPLPQQQNVAKPDKNEDWGLLQISKEETKIQEKQTFFTETQNYKKVEERIKTTQNKIDKVVERLNMTRISEERCDQETRTDDKEQKPKDEDPTLKFPNLVDSVRLTDSRFSQGRNMRSMKSLKYIFPTSYIGNSTTAQAAVNQSNSTTNTVCLMPKKSEYVINKTVSYPVSSSGIPIPKNHVKHATSLVNVVPVKRLVKSLKNSTSNGVTKMKVNGEKKDDVEESVTESADVECKKEDELVDENKDHYNEKSNEKKEDTSSSASVITSPSDADRSIAELKEEEGQTYKMCIFCFAREDWFTEEKLNLHYWKTCPMLTRCIYCKEVIEISGLIHHRLDECEQKYLFQKCNVCLEAILKEDFNQHECIPNETKNSKTRCPLCHEDIGQGEDQWKNHLMGPSSCTNNPRRKSKGKKSPTHKKENTSAATTTVATENQTEQQPQPEQTEAIT